LALRNSGVDGRGSLKKVAAAFAVLASLCVVAIAHGEVVQNFNFQLKDVKPNGRFTVVFSSQSYDTSGGVPDPLMQNYIRLPKGAVLRKQFMKRKYYCDLKKLVDRLRTDHPNAPHFNDLLNKTIRGRRAPPKSAKNLIAVCRYAHLGGGTVLVDARPFAADPIPAHFEMFWTKPDKGAVGTFAVVGSADDGARGVTETIRNTHPIVNISFVNDPTPDGLYQYKIVLPTGPIAGINVSFAEVHATTQGLNLVQKSKKCQKKRRGKCVRTKVKKRNLFWFTEPTCPPSGQISFEAFYAYAHLPSQTKTITIPCPKFRR
jgi:hypothetical protein